MVFDFFFEPERLTGRRLRRRRLPKVDPTAPKPALLAPVA